MSRAHSLVLSGLSLSAVLLAGCQDGPQSPQSRPELPVGPELPDGVSLAPVDLRHICGNKFLVSNSSGGPVEVTYRVVGTDESGSLTLQEGMGDEDEGYSETELTTRERGIVEIERDGEVVARRLNRGTPCGASPARVSVANLVSAESGEWSAPFPWPLVAVHLHLLPTGKVLSWGLSGTPQLWDPRSGNFSEVSEPAELFCSGHALLDDGRLMVAGGHISNDHGLPAINLFNPGSESWTVAPPMRLGRWYPTTIALGSGGVVIIGGRDETGVKVATPEVWSGGSLRELNTAVRTVQNYPRTFLAPDGRIFYAGEEVTSRYLDLSGSGSWSTVGTLLYGARDYGAAVMYDVGKIMYVGGGRTTNTAEIINLNSSAPAWQWTGSMAYARRNLNATLLPTGEVLVTGGVNGTVKNDLTRAVYAAEVWNPITEIWTTLASNSIPRGYHSTSILLPDGRVLHTGSGETVDAPNQLSAELFSPPYLFRGPRPSISAPSRVAYGSSFRVVTADAAQIAKVSLIRLGSTTHAFNMNQRFQWLSFTRGSGFLTITAPVNRNHAPPGHYLLFILNGEGSPSVGQIVKLGAESEPPLNVPPAAAFTSTCRGSECRFSDGSTDDGTITEWSWDFGDGGSGSGQNPTHTYASEGPYQVTLTVSDNDHATNAVSQTVTIGPPPPNVEPVASFTQSCIGLQCTFTDTSTDDWLVSGWSWDFGDGGTANTRNPSHTYEAEGQYPISLTVTDNDGATGAASLTITISTAPPNRDPVAAFTYSCSGLSCQFSNGSSDAEGSVSSSWDFGDETGASTTNPSHTYAGGGTFKVVLVVTDGDGATATTSQAVTVTVPNAAPRAAFTHICFGLTCRFTDRSTDSDGTIAAWRWNFGNGTGSTNRNPSRTYAASGSYIVTLRVTDNASATNQVRSTITARRIVLTVTGRVDATRQYMTLVWSGARGTRVDIYRDGRFYKSEVNDGRWVNSRLLPGASKYTYYLCETGTKICSNQASVVF